MPPKSQQEQTTSLELPQRMIESPESSLPVELLFSDAAGIYWHRDRFGRLTHIVEGSLLAGERYFFKPKLRDHKGRIDR